MAHDGYSIPNASAAAFSAQAELFSQDLQILGDGIHGNGVLNGCAVTQRGAGANMSVDVAAGNIVREAVTVVVAGGNAVVSAAHATLPRIDVVSVNDVGALVVTTGTATAVPEPPTIPQVSNVNNIVLAFVYVPAADTAITTNQLTDKRVLVQAPGSAAALSNLTSAHNALSNRVSANSGGGGAGSVTSTEVSAVSAQAASAISQLNSVVSQKLSILSQGISVVSQAVSVETAARVAADNVLSNAISAVSSLVSNLTSAHNVLSNRVSANSGTGGAASVTSQELSVAAAALSVRIDTQSQGVSVLSQQVSLISQAVSNEISNRISADNALSAKIDTNSQAISVLSQQASVISQLVSALTSAHDVLSNRVSANSGVGGGGGSVTSTEVSAGDAAVSAQAASAISALQAAVGTIKTAFLATTAVVSATTLTDIAGLTVSAGDASGVYAYDARVLFRLLSAGQVYGFGLTFPGLVAGGGLARAAQSATAAGGAIVTTWMQHGRWSEAASGSILLSGSAGANGITYVALFEGVMLLSAAPGLVEIQAKASTGATGQIHIFPGSYARLVKVGQA